MQVVQRVIVVPNYLSISGRPYHDQGDPSMYTAESLAAREALRSAPVVIDAVARFSMLYRLDADRFVPWSEYRRVHTAAALILAPGVRAARGGWMPLRTKNPTLALTPT